MAPAPVLAIPALIRRRSWWLVLLAVWGLAVWFALQAHIADIRQQSTRVATEGARNMFRMVVLTRGWNAGHGGVYVPVTPAMQPNPYLDHPRRDVTTRDGIALTLINPAYMTRLIAQMAELDSGAIFRLTSLKPIRPENAPDDWERRSLEAFETGVRESIDIVSGSNGKVLRYMAPLLVQKACLQCHARQGYKEGDIRGGISVSQRYAPIEAATAASIRQSSLNYGAVFVLVATLGWLLLELLRRRWFELAGKIQELEDTRGELVQTEKMASLGRMVAGFAHEINTPIGVAVGAVSQTVETAGNIDAMLGEEEVDGAALRAELETLHQGGNLALANLGRARNLVQSFKRTSIDLASEEVRVFGVRGLIDDVLCTLQGTLKHHDVRITVDCAGDLQLRGTPGLLEQVLTNLMLNALQHAFEGGKRPGSIRIAAASEGGALHMIFSDDGVGMPAEQVQHIFEPFYTTRRGQGGSGLGLFICYNIVSGKLGGSIQCQSTPDAGCTFDIRFPAEIMAGAGK